MKIEFGWCLNGAAWRPTAVRGALGAVRTGPRGLLGILQTRLGLSHPESKPALRIGQYLRVLQAVVADDPASWFAESLSTDPWNTAAQLLDLRDSAVEAGWDAEQPLPTGPAVERLQALARVESQVVVGTPGAGAAEAGTTSLAPGSADDVRAVAAELRDLTSAGMAWPLGIESITVADPIDALPGLWPEILSLISRLGVAVEEEPPADGGDETSLRIVQAPDELSAAEAAARFLHHSPQEPDRLSVLAGTDSTNLDAALTSRGLPSVGAGRHSGPGPESQLLTLALQLTEPTARSAAGYRIVDLNTLRDLLGFALPRVQDDGVGRTHARVQAAHLFPGSVRHTLLGALDAEAGLSNDPDSAWARALAKVQDAADQAGDDDRDQREKAAAVAKALDDALSEAITRKEFLEWLRKRADKLGQSQDSPGFLAASLQLSSFFEICEWLGLRLEGDAGGADAAAPVASSARILGDIARAVGNDATTRVHVEQAARWNVVDSPAHIPAGTQTLVWWNAVADGGRPTSRWDPAETAALQSAGARIVPQRELERLQIDSALRGLSGVRQVLVCYAKRSADQQLELHPYVSYLAAQLEPGQAVEKVIERATVSASTLVASDRWELDGATCAVEQPIEWVPPRPEALTRVVPDGAVLLPNRLSYSQVSRLLTDPLAWVLEHAMGIQRSGDGGGTSVNRDIGNAVHGALEALWNERRNLPAGQRSALPTRSQVDAVFDAAVPRLASQLLLTGRGRELDDARQRTEMAVERLYRAVQDAEIHQTDSEASFEFELDLPANLALPTITFIGRRDFDGQDRAGRPVVIDFKWSNSARYKREEFNEGLAVQLAAYAHSVSAASAADAAGAPILAYYMLKQAEFISADPRLGSEQPPPEDFAALWRRTVSGIGHVLDQLRSGRVESPTAEAYFTHPGDDKAAAERLDILAETARAEGRLFLADRFYASNGYSLVTGLAGDYS